MVAEKVLQVFLVSDTQGNDDEGMKKIARKLGKYFQEVPGVNPRIVSILEAIQSIRTADILHYVGGPTYRSVLIAALCKMRNKNLRTILTFSNPHWNSTADSIIKIFPPDCVIVSSIYWQKWAKKIGIPSELLVISGVEINRFTPVSHSKKKILRKELGLPLDKKLILHVGHLKDDRNLLELLKVQKHSDLQVVVIGSTTTKQSDRLIKQLETAGCIVFRRYQPKIEYFYQSADCYVFPTVDQAAAVQIPLSILEAMATNLPIVSTRFGGLADFFSETINLKFLSSNEFGDLAKIINTTIRGSLHMNKDIQKYSWEDVVDRLSRIYRNLSRVTK